MTAEAVNTLLVEDDEAFAHVVSRSLRQREYAVSHASELEQATALIQSQSFVYAILDLNLGGESSLSLIRPLKTRNPDCRILILTGYASIATAVEAIKRGACNYLCKPADADDVLAALLSEHADLDTLVPENPMSVDRLQWEHIQRVLTEHEGNISATARALGMHRRTLQRKLQKRPVRR